MAAQQTTMENIISSLEKDKETLTTLNSQMRKVEDILRDDMEQLKREKEGQNLQFSNKIESLEREKRAFRAEADDLRLERDEVKTFPLL